MARRLLGAAAVVLAGCGGGGGGGEDPGETSSCDGTGLWATQVHAESPGCDLSGNFAQNIRVTKGGDGAYAFDIETIGDTEFTGDTTGHFEAAGTGCRMLATSVLPIDTGELTGTNTTEYDYVADADGVISGTATLEQIVNDGANMSGCLWTLEATGTKEPL